MNPIVVIPARGGSKGVPRKNIKKLGGKHLIEYTISAAREVFEDEAIIVSTDDREIKTIVEQIGLKVPFIRPKALATDTASTQDVLIHAIEHVESKGLSPDVIVLLQPTSPFRRGYHIKEAIDLYKKYPDIDMVVSVKETNANPYYVLFEEDELGFLKKSKEGSFTRRQDCPKVWEYNGAIYIISINSLKRMGLNRFERIIKYEMNELSSVDIDSFLDWKTAELLLSEVIKND